MVDPPPPPPPPKKKKKKKKKPNQWYKTSMFSWLLSNKLLNELSSHRWFETSRRSCNINVIVPTSPTVRTMAMFLTFVRSTCGFRTCNSVVSSPPARLFLPMTWEIRRTASMTSCWVKYWSRYHSTRGTVEKDTPPILICENERQGCKPKNSNLFMTHMWDTRTDYYVIYHGTRT